MKKRDTHQKPMVCDETRVEFKKEKHKHHHHHHHPHHHHHHDHHHGEESSSSSHSKEEICVDVERDHHRHEEGKHRHWQALDMTMSHPTTSGNAISQEGEQTSSTKQDSDESILVKDSCNVAISTTDTKAAVNLQAALQLAIALIISLTVASGDRAEAITQELLQKTNVRQTTEQRLIVENSRDVNVTTTDTEIAVNIQLLLQILLAIIAKIEIL